MTVIRAEERRELRQRIRALWEQGCDTAEMSRVLHVPEHECERELHVALEYRRSIVNSLVQS